MGHHLRVMADEHPVQPTDGVKNETKPEDAPKTPEDKPADVPVEPEVKPKKPIRNEGVIDLGITDGNRMQYYTKLYVGSKRQELKFAFSTVNPLTLLNSDTCQGCNTDSDGVKGFKYDASETVRKVSDIKVTYTTEGEQAKGALISDTVQLFKDDNSTFIKEYPFMLISEWTQDKYEQTQGVVGLSRTYYSTNGLSSGPTFLNSLFDKGLIKERKFAVHFDD